MHHRNIDESSKFNNMNIIIFGTAIINHANNFSYYHCLGIDNREFRIQGSFVFI
jgi:hypothetical protein